MSRECEMGLAEAVDATTGMLVDVTTDIAVDAMLSEAAKDAAQAAEKNKAAALSFEAESLLDGILAEGDFSKKHPEFKTAKPDTEDGGSVREHADSSRLDPSSSRAARKIPTVSVSGAAIPSFNDFARDEAGFDGMAKQANVDLWRYDKKALRRKRREERREEKRARKRKERAFAARTRAAAADAPSSSGRRPGARVDDDHASKKGIARKDAAKKGVAKKGGVEKGIAKKGGVKEDAAKKEKGGGKPASKKKETRGEHMETLRRRKLRKVLAIAIACLVVLASAGVAFFLLDNGDGRPQDDATQLDGGGEVSRDAFSGISADALPTFTEYFGQPVSALVKASDGRIVLDGGTQASSDPEVPALVSLQKARLDDASGNKVASLAFGLDSSAKIVYAYCSGDLDALHVASVGFETLLSDKTVAASYLVACGMREVDAQAAALTLKEKPDCRSGTGADGDSAVFSGKTGFTTAPTTWKLMEKYDKSVGKTLGDNSVLRTITVELY